MPELKQINNDNSCIGICSYYDANAKFRKGKSAIFRKWCPVCKLDLISKLRNCPCCHSPTRKGMFA